MSKEKNKIRYERFIGNSDGLTFINSKKDDKKDKPKKEGKKDAKG